MPQNPETVLIVDDNPDVTLVLKLLFARAGFHVFVADNGEEGLSVAEREIPSVILCDERLPRLDGFHTFLRLKGNAHTAHIPVVITGGTDMNGERNWEDCGAAAFLPKPFQFHELLTVVRHALSSAHPH